MITVAITNDFPYWPLQRQTPGGAGIWGNCRFVINQPDVPCDAWVVMHNLPRSESHSCRQGATLLLTLEPPEVWPYDRRFAEQFDHVITCENTLRGPKVVRGQQGLPWMVGGSWLESEGRWHDDFRCSYDELAADPLPEKTRLMSVISSDKAFTPGHRARQTLVRALAAHFGDRLDVFGRGIRPVPDKWDALAPYRYHVAIENSCVADYWTEKLADTLLADAHPFYLGCPNIGRYFAADVLTVLPSYDPDFVIPIMEAALAAHVFERTEAERTAVRKIILNDYNLFAMIAQWAESLPETSRATRELRPQQYYTSQLVPRIGRQFGRVARRLGLARRPGGPV